jgi:PAS domain S-box-containing protein
MGFPIPEKNIPDNEIGDMIKTRNQMVEKLTKLQNYLRERSEQLEELYIASREILAFVDGISAKKEILKRMLSLTCKLVGAKYGVLALIDERTLKHILFLQHGLTDDEEKLIGDPPKGIGMLGKLLDYGKKDPNAVIIINDLSKYKPYFPPHHPVMKTFLGVPIATPRRVYGRIYLTEKENNRSFTEEDANLVKGFAQMIALILEAGRLKEEIEMTERKYQELYNNAPIGLYELDSKGIFKAVNSTLLKWLGYEQKDIIGNRYETLLTEDGKRKVREIAEKCKQGKVIENMELEFIKKDGTILPVQVNILPKVDENGNIIGCEGTARDITKERELKDQLLHAQKMEAIGILAGGIAHDFNNILQVILGNAQLIHMQMRKDDKMRDKIETILRAVSSGSSIVRQLLMFSRKGEAKKDKLDLNSLIVKFSNMLRKIIGEDIELKINMDPKVGIIYGDRTQIEQILLNLSTNARDAMPNGGVLSIETKYIKLDENFCRLRPEIKPGDYALVTVTDTGVGMDDETMERIFEPFFTTKGIGTGLGLSVVYGIVKEHEGLIEVESEIGKGTKFKIYLPLLSKGEGKLEMEEFERSSNYKGSGTILIAEDEEQVREIASMMMNELGYKVIQATNGKEAVDIFRQKADEIDLVILDIIMPKLGGKEAFYKIRSIHPTIPILFTTGYTYEQTIVDSIMREGKNVDLLFKPYRMTEIGQKVKSLMGKT